MLGGCKLNEKYSSQDYVGRNWIFILGSLSSSGEISGGPR